MVFCICCILLFQGATVMSISGSLSFKLKDVIEIERPEYVYLRLIPSNSIKNNASTKIINSIASLYTEIDKRIRYVDKKLHYEQQPKLGFFIYMENSSIQFYMIVPEKSYSLYKERIIDTWSNRLTIEVCTELPQFEHNCTKYYMTYKKDDALSLECDCRDNYLLSTVLNATHIMESGDKLGVFYNFTPCDNKSWKSKYDRTYEKLRSSESVPKIKFNVLYILTLLCNLIIKASDIILNSINLGSSEKKLLPMRDLEISKETGKKREHTIVNAQIICFSQSEDKKREYNNALALTSAYECLDGDNKLIRYKYNKSCNLLDAKIKGAESIKIMDREGQNFISLPGRELIDSYKQIEHTNVLETQVPAELQSGTIGIGTSTYKGSDTNSYLPTSQNERNLALVLIGPTRAGKSTLISNLAHDAGLNGECNVLFDFCGNCELSDTIARIPGIKILNVDCSKYESLQGLGYNEIRSDDKNIFEQYKNAKTKTTQLLALINSVNADDRDLKAKMNKILSAVANVVFIGGGSVNDVFQALQDHKLRQEFIMKIPYTQRSNLEDYVTAMSELDDKSRDGAVTGTKYNLITGIMDRINGLKQNTYMELMLKKSCSSNFNLIDELQKNQTICFRMPESMFSTQEEKDTYVTYWLSKIWIALKFRQNYIARDKHVKVNIFIDELSQVHHSEEYVRGILSQMAKFNAKPILSCHYLNQINIIREELKSANCSYMLISGCNKDNYRELKEELEPYTVDDLLSLKKFHSLNLIKLPDGYVKFVTKLPPEL